MIGTLRTIFTPGVFSGTMTIEWRLCAPAASSDTPITMAKAQFGCSAPLVNHLRPLMT